MSRLTKTDVALIVLALVYILMPLDFIPELLTGPLGLTDDVAAFALIGATLMRARSRQPAPVALPAGTVVPATVTYERPAPR